MNKLNSIPNWIVLLIGILVGVALTLTISHFASPKVVEVYQPVGDNQALSDAPDIGISEQDDSEQTGLSEPSSEVETSSASESSEADITSTSLTSAATTASSKYIIWSAESVYVGGDTVQHENGLYRAKWWTQGEAPTRSGSAAWEYLGEIPTEEEPEQTSVGQKPPATPISSDKFKVVVYAPSWSEHGLSKVDFSVVTHINYAFAIPREDGTLLPLENSGYAKRIISETHRNNRKILLAVGGWSYNDVPLEATFKAATDTDEKLTRFAENILTMCSDYGFDGIDMDWEHPRQDDGTKLRYEKLMLYLAEKLHAEGKLLTSAVLSGATPDNTIYYDAAAHSDKVLAAVDWINVMAYDGGDGERHSSYDFAVNCGKYWHNTRSMPAEKVVLGVPFYARPSWAAYSAILAADSSADQSDVSVFNGMTAHYNGVDTITKKTQFALDELGGIMVWEICQDTTEASKSLLQAIKSTIMNNKNN